MRSVRRPGLLLAACGLASASLLAAGGWAQVPAHVTGSARPGHEITCGSQRALREYREGLRQLYAGDAEAALRDLLAASRRDPSCAMAHWAVSRAHHKAGRLPEAVAAADRARELAPLADDREQRLVNTWTQYVKSLQQPEGQQKGEQDRVRNALNEAIALYPEDPEVWLQRALVAESPLRGAPFILAALRLQPDHPYKQSWRLSAPPAPELKPASTQPVGAISPAPKLFDGLGKLTHRVTTNNAVAQAYYEQGLRCFHSYVLPAHRPNSSQQCFQYAANLDPDFAMAYWGLTFGHNPAYKNLDAANRALELALKNGSDKERRFAAARLLELTNGKREEFLDALDAAIVAYPDDVELWTWRGKVWGGYGFGTGNPQGIPYQLAALMINAEHPSPNHELVHAFESLDRPALGWRFTEAYRASAPNMPHANHMQAHLAMRIGRWQDAIDSTRFSRRRSLEGYPELDPSHHIDILMRALAHEGRFKEAESEPQSYRDGLPWARLLQLKGIPEELSAWAQRRGNAPDGVYISALVKLDAGDLEAARPLVERVEQLFKNQPANAYRLQEVKGRFLVQSGQVDEGLKILREAAQKAVKDSGLHAWGGGSYVLEVWGEAAMRARRWDEAEEAYHEALAHEHGSILGALGMQVVWEQRGRTDMAQHYASRARSIWKDANPGALDRQLTRIRKIAAASMTPAAAAAAAPANGGNE